MTRKAIIAGGAGFVGSHIAERFVGEGYDVVVIDGLFERTGAAADNVPSGARFVHAAIEQTESVAPSFRGADVVVDAMGWTSHREALRDPEYDLALNLRSHVALLRILRTHPATVIYLGSRTQYGRPAVAQITEATPMVPEDVQGIHKVAAESHFRVASKFGINAVSLRFPNCFGERQPVKSADIGLIASLARDLIRGETVEVFGSGRQRNVVYAGDVAEVVLRIAQQQWNGFTALNMAGLHVTIEDLVQEMISVLGGGHFVRAQIPPEVAAIDMGDADVDDTLLRRTVGDVAATELRTALKKTVEAMRRELSALAM